MLDNYSEYSQINPLYGGSLPLTLNEVLHYAGLPFNTRGERRSSSLGYISLEEFLIRTNYPNEVSRSIRIAIQDQELLDIKVRDLYYENSYLHFDLIESNMDCTKIYLSPDNNRIQVKYLAYIEFGGKEWGHYRNQS